MTTESTTYTEKHLELVREFQKLTGIEIDQLTERTVNEGVSNWMKLFAPAGEELDEKELPPHFQRIFALVKEQHENARPVLKVMIESFVAFHLSETELPEIIAFCRTDVGKKIVELGGMRVPVCTDVCWRWSEEVQKRFCSTPEFTELANGVNTSAQTAQELAPGQSVEQPQP